MKQLFQVARYCLGVCLLGSLSAFANPAPPSAYPVLSEIQITDELHWKVEVDASKGGMSYDVRYPDTIDSFFLFCGTATPPSDSMCKPAIGEVFDSKGIAVLTPSHFPSLKLRKGAVVFLTFGNGTSGKNWKAQIPSDITSSQSVVGSVAYNCCEYMSNTCVMYCPSAVYSVSNTPTIGAPNLISAVVPRKNTVPEASGIRLMPSKERRQIVVAVSGQTGNRGDIDLIAPDGALVRSIRFTCRGTGTYTVRWDGNNGQGLPVPAGTYICRVKVGENKLCQGFVAW